jgi:hypothetical protein
VTVVAEEARVVVPLLAHVVGGEVQAVAGVLPVRDEGRHVVVHGHVRVPVYGPADTGQIPTPAVVGILEEGEVEAPGRGDREEVAEPRCVVDVPIRRARKEQPIVAPRLGPVALLGGAGMDHPYRAVRVDVEDGDEGVLFGPVVDPHPVTAIEERLFSTVEPEVHRHGVGVIVGSEALGWQLLGEGVAGSEGQRERRDGDGEVECGRAHGLLLVELGRS